MLEGPASCIPSGVPIEKISVTVPGAGVQIIDVEARLDEGDDDIAKRLARTFPVGTLLGISGAKWRILSKDPPEVEEVGVQKRPSSVPPPGVELPSPGELWRPKDPRRKQSGFRIKAVTETHVEAEDGRTVALERLKRYEKIG